MEFDEFLRSPVFIVAFIVDFILKAFALWKCGRNNQPYWYSAILFLNTAGIIPVIYLIGFQKINTNHYKI
jgi:hypothetical protein